MEYSSLAYSTERIAHWDALAQKPTTRWSAFYHRRTKEIYRFIVSPGRKLLELGCGRGDLLAGLNPSYGVGVDFSPNMVAVAGERHPELRFVCGDAHQVKLTGAFDAVIMSDLLNDVWDVQKLLNNTWQYCHDGTRLVINTFSRLWQPLLNTVRSLGLAEPLLRQNWLMNSDIANLLYLEGFEVIKEFRDILLPLDIPLLNPLANRYFSKILPFKWFALTSFIIARRIPPSPSSGGARVSVIVAARNEAGNIPEILRRTPEMGGGTELIFVEGGSTDNTFAAIEKAMQSHPNRRVKLFRQTGRGKGDAVRLGLSKAEGEILMILDADMTVAPEDLPLFYQMITRGKGEFINGVRLVYPMEKQAMRFFNLLGNKFFSLTFSWLLEQPIKDTLCGTKVISRENYLKLSSNRTYFGDFDPFGDFDLLFGAAKLGLKIVDLPIRYRERTYGETNIQRWKHGWLLIRMALFAAGRIKFV
jgi:ubiquinone/menaquinone biosynthesis C-methylase UbiE